LQKASVINSFSAFCGSLIVINQMGQHFKSALCRIPFEDEAAGVVHVGHYGYGVGLSLAQHFTAAVAYWLPPVLE